VDDSIDENAYSKIIQDFIFINNNNTLIYGNKDFKTKRNPKISVILSVRNGEAFIRAAVRSIQNQDLNDVEIIIVDDASEDKSVEVIKNLMDEDGRIIFIQNKENKGILYTRAIGILEARGKYMLILDVDDLFAVENAFSIMYEESEKNNLDILGFVSTQGRLNLDNFIYTRFSYHNNLETSIINQQELSKLAFNQNSNGETIGFRDVVWDI
jgi:glycosyltransferase involved in cell wall biosynthesis